ncbi:hypothetical protein CUTER_06475 [Corynebacterium uterequi]|uniref:Uncharacterized protein n=1 Tax=Corynebacterium uterequi TaxID=1072256 RepID=A0A0G3HD98_9CORY|nr:hypothetical protein CUTER_06475 [Corynebacterium uterequi]
MILGLLFGALMVLSGVAGFGYSGVLQFPEDAQTVTAARP